MIHILEVPAPNFSPVTGRSVISRVLPQSTLRNAWIIVQT